jgi:demethoxyubiquinone hydroxylase (CLK1/Coq7/Cat5 family)
VAKSAKSEGATVGSFEAKNCKAYVERIERIQSEIDENLADVREENEPLYADIAAIKKEARENHSIPARELNSIIAKRKMLRKAEAVRAKLSDEQKDNFDAMELVLGMGELGAAAIRREMTEAERSTAH